VKFKVVIEKRNLTSKARIGRVVKETALNPCDAVNCVRTLTGMTCIRVDVELHALLLPAFSMDTCTIEKQSLMLFIDN
jgi:hypothetical protein